MKDSRAKPIFIVGNGRSGTTMLGEILTRSGVGRSFEGHFVAKALQELGKDNLTVTQLRNLVSLILSYESSQRFGLKLDELMYDTEKGITAKEVILDSLEMIASNHPEKQWIEKTPNYIYSLSTLLQHFPDAKIIWMLRDGRDVANSVLQKSWGANNIYYAATEWIRANYQNSALNDPRVLLVKYAELLSKPSNGLIRIFDFEIMSKIRPDISWYHKLSCKRHHRFKLVLHLLNENIFKLISIKLGLKQPFSENN